MDGNHKLIRYFVSTCLCTCNGNLLVFPLQTGGVLLFMAALTVIANALLISVTATITKQILCWISLLMQNTVWACQAGCVLTEGGKMWPWQCLCCSIHYEGLAGAVSLQAAAFTTRGLRGYGVMCSATAQSSFTTSSTSWRAMTS